MSLTFEEMINEDLARIEARRAYGNRCLVCCAIGIGFGLACIYAAVFRHDIIGGDALLAAAIVAVVSARLELWRWDNERAAHKVVLHLRYPQLFPSPYIETKEN